MQKLVFRNGAGNEIDLTTGNFGITNWAGLSNTPLNIQTQQVPFEDGGVFLDALMEQREIDLTVAINDNNNLELRYQLKRELISALNPKLGEGVLIYTNDYLSRQIHAVPQIPLFENKNSNDKGTLKASVTFSCPSPYWEDVEETKIPLKNGALVLENKGDVKIGLKIDAFLDNSNFSIRNDTQGRQIAINENLNDIIIANTQTGRKSVITNKITGEEIYKDSYYNILYISHLSTYIAIKDSNRNQVFSIRENSKQTNIFTCASGNIIKIIYIQQKKTVIIFSSHKAFITTDLENFTEITIEQTKNIYDAKYIEELDMVVVVGSDGLVITSTDLEIWTSQTSGVSTQLNCLEYCYGKIIVFGNSGTQIESGNGIVWQNRSTGDDDIIYCLKDVSGSILIKGNTNKYIYKTSSSGNWTTVTFSNKGIIYSSTDNIYILVAQNQLLKSSDLENWKEVTEINNSGIKTIGFLKNVNQYVVSYYNGAFLVGSILASLKNIGFCLPADYFVYNEKLKVYVLKNDTEVYKSSNMNDFVKVYEVESGYRINSINYINEKMVFGVSENGNNYVLQTEDLENWSFDECINGSIEDLIWAESIGCYLEGITGKILKSDDLINWDIVYSDLSGHKITVCWSEEKKVAIALHKTLSKYSYDGVDWLDCEVMGVTPHFLKSAYSNFLHYFIAGGHDPNLFYSEDGKTLSVINPNISDPNVIMSIDEMGIFLILDNHYILLGSGYSFTKIELPIRLDVFYSFTYANGEFIINARNCYMRLKLLSDENIINRLTSDSDMGLALEVGENKIVISCNSVIGTIYYRQKYIGV